MYSTPHLCAFPVKFRVVSGVLMRLGSTHKSTHAFIRSGSIGNFDGSSDVRGSERCFPARGRTAPRVSPGYRCPILFPPEEEREWGGRGRRGERENIRLQRARLSDDVSACDVRIFPRPRLYKIIRTGIGRFRFGLLTLTLL